MISTNEFKTNVTDNVREWLYKAQIFFMGIILLLFLYTVVAYIFPNNL